MKISREIGGNCRSFDYRGTKQASQREKYQKTRQERPKNYIRKKYKKIFVDSEKKNKFVKKKLRKILQKLLKEQPVGKLRKS